MFDLLVKFYQPYKIVRDTQFWLNEWLYASYIMTKFFDNHKWFLLAMEANYSWFINEYESTHKKSSDCVHVCFIYEVSKIWN